MRHTSMFIVLVERFLIYTNTLCFGKENLMKLWPWHWAQLCLWNEYIVLLTKTIGHFEFFLKINKFLECLCSSYIKLVSYKGIRYDCIALKWVSYKWSNEISGNFVIDTEFNIVCYNYITSITLKYTRKSLCRRNIIMCLMQGTTHTGFWTPINRTGRINLYYSEREAIYKL